MTTIEGGAPWEARAWPPLLLSVGCVVAYALFLAMPFYFNDLAVYSVQDGFWRVVLAGAGLLMLFYGPWLAVFGLLWSLWAFFRTSSRGRRRLLVASGVIAIAPLVWLCTPGGVDTVSWWLD